MLREGNPPAESHTAYQWLKPKSAPESTSLTTVQYCLWSQVCSLTWGFSLSVVCDRETAGFLMSPQHSPSASYKDELMQCWWGNWDLLVSLPQLSPWYNQEMNIISCKWKLYSVELPITWFALQYNSLLDELCPLGLPQIHVLKPSFPMWRYLNRSIREVVKVK